MTAIKLIPADRKRCQAESRAAYNFMTFGKPLPVRCSALPVYIAKEIKPGKDGRRGSMSLCEECAIKMKKVMGKKYATLTKIRRTKKCAQK